MPGEHRDMKLDRQDFGGRTRCSRRRTESLREAAEYPWFTCGFVRNQRCVLFIDFVLIWAHWGVERVHIIVDL